LSQKLRVLGVNAHPHDFTWYAGTLGIHAASGDTVTVVSVTTGESAHNEALHDELMKPEAERDLAVINQKPGDFSALKAKEMEEACAIFGITDVRNLGFPMPFKVGEYPESVRALREVILDVRPHIMITQSPFLNGHQGKASGATDDHYETAFMSLEARSQAANPVFGDTEAPHAIATVYYPGVYFQNEEFDFVVDITDWFEKRVAAEDKYISQGHYPAWSRRRMEVSLGNVGWFAGTMYGEAFVREKPELVSRMTVAESDLRRASEPIGDYYDRIVGERPPAH
jgi:LmbE family N-acetylglucosaminyl deacetylase